MPIEKARQNISYINKLGKDEGIDFRYAIFKSSFQPTKEWSVPRKEVK